MKKTTLLLLFSSSTLLAQTFKKNDVLIGSNFNLNFKVPEKNTSSGINFGLGLNPNIEFVQEDRLAINLGVGYDFGFFSYKSPSGSSIQSNTFTAQLGFKEYLFPNEKVAFFFGLGGQYFNSLQNYKNKNSSYSTKKGSSKFINVNVNTGFMYAIKPKLFLVTQVNFANFNILLNNNNLFVEYNTFETQVNTPIYFGIKKLIKK